MANAPKLLDQMRNTLRRKHYAYRTEKTYIDWARRYILYHDKRHPKDMGIPEIEKYLTYLAVERKISASTQNPCTELIEAKPLQESFSFTPMC